MLEHQLCDPPTKKGGYLWSPRREDHLLECLTMMFYPEGMPNCWGKLCRKNQEEMVLSQDCACGLCQIIYAWHNSNQEGIYVFSWWFCVGLQYEQYASERAWEFISLYGILVYG